MDLETAVQHAAQSGGPEQIARALGFAVKYGDTEGSHHKAWVIDQMVRALTGCPIENATATDHNGQPYEYPRQGESEQYRALIAAACDGEDGPETYAWDEGVAP